VPRDEAEYQLAPGQLGQFRLDLDLGADRAGPPVLQRHPGAHGRHAFAQVCLQRRDARGLGQRQQPGGGEHRDIPAAGLDRGIRVGHHVPHRRP